jgi:hypothetical protein
MSFTHMFFDGDDAYYVANSVITNETGTMYRILPYTGGTTDLDIRHALAMFPMWISYIAGMSGMHPANVTHSLMPLLMIPLADLTICHAARRFLKGDGTKTAAFHVRCRGAADLRQCFHLYAGNFFTDADLAGQIHFCELDHPCGFLDLFCDRRSVWHGEGEEGKPGREEVRLADAGADQSDIGPVHFHGGDPDHRAPVFMWTVHEHCAAEPEDLHQYVFNMCAELSVRRASGCTAEMTEICRQRHDGKIPADGRAGEKQL